MKVDYTKGESLMGSKTSESSHQKNTKHGHVYFKT